MTLTELQEAVTELGLLKYAARQIADWVYVNGSGTSTK